MNNINKWGIKTNQGYVTSITNDTNDNSSSVKLSNDINNICTFSQPIAENHAQEIKIEHDGIKDAIVFPIKIMDTTILKIPKNVADCHDKLIWAMDLENQDWKNTLPSKKEESRFWAWRKKNKTNEQIYQIYSASKALGLDIVQIIE